MTMPVIDFSRPEDQRTVMGWHEPVRLAHPNRCTTCWNHKGDDSLKEDIVCIKIHHARMPLGYLYSRCPPCWADYTSRVAP